MNCARSCGALAHNYREAWRREVAGTGFVAGAAGGGGSRRRGRAPPRQPPPGSARTAHTRRGAAGAAARGAGEQARVLLLGHSHGGTIAQQVASAYPDRVARLILADTAACVSEFLTDIEAAVARFRDQPWFADAYAALQREWAGDYTK